VLIETEKAERGAVGLIDVEEADALVNKAPIAKYALL